MATEQQEGDNQIDFGDIDFNTISLEGITTAEDVTNECQPPSSSEGYHLSTILFRQYYHYSWYKYYTIKSEIRRPYKITAGSETLH